MQNLRNKTDKLRLVQPSFLIKSACLQKHVHGLVLFLRVFFSALRTDSVSADEHYRALLAT